MTTPAIPQLRQAQPVAGGGSFDVTPYLRDMLGYLIIVKPTAHDPNAVFKATENGVQKDVPRPTVRANILVLDASHLGLRGGPLEFGGDGRVKPHTDRIALPAYFENVLISQSNPVKDLSAHLNEVSMGVPFESDKGKMGNPPLNLGPVDADQWGRPRIGPDGQEVGARLVEFAGQQFAAWSLGQLTPNTVSELIAPLPQASPDAHKAYADRLAKRQQAQQQVQQQPAPAQPAAYAPQYTQPQVGQPAPATNPVHDYPASAPPANPYAPGQPPAGAASAPQVQQQPMQAQAVTTDALPPGWQQTAWDNVDGATRAMIWQGIRAANPQLQPTH